MLGSSLSRFATNSKISQPFKFVSRQVNNEEASKRFFSISSSSIARSQSSLMSNNSLNLKKKDFVQKRGIIVTNPTGGIIPSNYREAVRELNKVEPDPNDPNQTITALENVVYERDGTVPQMDYSITQLFWDTINPLMQGIEATSSQYGVPMWATIAGTAALTRFIVLPLTIKAMKVAAEVAGFMPANNAYMEKIKEAKQKNNVVALTRLQDEWKTFHSQQKVTPFAPLKYALLQTPVFMGFYFAIYKLVEQSPLMKDGGIAWFQDLTAIDPYCRFGIISLAAMMLNFEYFSDNKLSGTQFNIMRGFTILMGCGMMWATYDFPMGVHLYWTSSIVVTLVVSFILRKTPLRAKLGIPETRVPTPAVAPTTAIQNPSQYTTIKDQVVYASKPKGGKQSIKIMDPARLNQKVK